MKAKAIRGEGSTLALADDWGAIVPLDPGAIRRAQIRVCEAAVDADEASELLAMLGIGGPS